MVRVSLTLRTVTPLLMNGAEGLEVRAASFRGVLRCLLQTFTWDAHSG